MHLFTWFLFSIYRKKERKKSEYVLLPLTGCHSKWMLFRVNVKRVWKKRHLTHGIYDVLCELWHTVRILVALRFKPLRYNKHGAWKQCTRPSIHRIHTQKQILNLFVVFFCSRTTQHTNYHRICICLWTAPPSVVGISNFHHFQCISYEKWKIEGEREEKI